MQLGLKLQTGSLYFPNFSRFRDMTVFINVFVVVVEFDFLTKKMHLFRTKVNRSHF